MKVAILLSAALLVVACGKQSAKLPEAAENAKQLAKNAAPAVANPFDPKVLITDDKLSRYMVYQKEMIPVSAIAVEVGVMAMKRSGGNQKEFEQEMAKDPRVKKVTDAQASAIAKSGLSMAEANEITNIAAAYTPGATMGDAEMKKKAREEFNTKYGPEVLAVMEKHLPELSKLQDEMLGAAFTKKK